MHIFFFCAFQNRRRRRRFSKSFFATRVTNSHLGLGVLKGISVLILPHSRVTQTQKPFFLSFFVSVYLLEHSRRTWGKLKKVAKKRFGRAGNHGAAGEKEIFERWRNSRRSEEDFSFSLGRNYPVPWGGGGSYPAAAASEAAALVEVVVVCPDPSLDWTLWGPATGPSPQLQKVAGSPPLLVRIAEIRQLWQLW